MFTAQQPITPLFVSAIPYGTTLLYVSAIPYGTTLLYVLTPPPIRVNILKNYPCRPSTWLTIYCPPWAYTIALSGAYTIALSGAYTKHGYPPCFMALHLAIFLILVVIVVVVIIVVVIILLEPVARNNYTLN
ncbi:MAG: hypothetical protein ACR2M6_00070 [Vampirovibrionia bacterium]